eukprot:gnl/MRDRNA2_/MRDRNA2_128160_c0_seq1.p1 gnl/MRDRNA2_/MRDRNA2_128160_c0~~gnl/MRDRNA2_/MRDRNA2_128160_c0_seq1.p1  ORF type:complete len:398 (-),score=56.35 gnl/MRDRNA2_/MRDRNA2_128160_c0_seq1:63-1256(-)
MFLLFCAPLLLSFAGTRAMAGSQSFSDPAPETPQVQTNLSVIHIGTPDCNADMCNIPVPKTPDEAMCWIFPKQRLPTESDDLSFHFLSLVSFRSIITPKTNPEVMDNVVKEISDLHEGNRYPCQMPRNMKVLVPRNARSSFAFFFLARLQDPRPFSFVRYGDGEWKCVMGHHFDNVDLAHASADMCQELANFTKSSIMRAGVDMLFSDQICKGFVSGVANLSQTIGTWYPFFGFLEFLRDTENNQLPAMMAATQARGVVVLVGPAYLGRLHVVFRHSAHIRVPNKRFCNDTTDSWGAHSQLEEKITTESRKAGEKQSVTFLIAAGMAAKILIMRMAAKLGHKDSFLDIGSTFDVFAGVITRPYQRNIKTLFNSAPNGDPTRIMLNWFNETDVDKVGC